MSKDIKINLSPSHLSSQLKDVLSKLRKYSAFIFIIGVLLIYGFLVLRVSSLSGAEPDEEAVAEQMKTVKRLKIDQNAVEKLEELEDQNVRVQALFEEARDNPFRN